MTGVADAAAVPLATIESVPLDQVLRFMDHESDNFTAEILLKQLGAGLALQGTSATGAQVIRQLLTSSRSRPQECGSSTAPASRGSIG